MCRLRMLAAVAVFCLCAGLIFPRGLSGQSKPISVDGKIIAEKLIKKVDPDYPEAAIRAKMEGTVRLLVSINERGEVTNVKVINGGDA